MTSYNKYNIGLLCLMGLSGLFADAALADNKIHNECKRTAAQEVHCSFDVTTTTVNFTGKDVPAMMMGGSIPAPTIHARVGDILTIDIHNKTDKETSVHWHGVLLPPEQDGVSIINTDPIEVQSSHRFRFPVIHHGTYWYHSHTGFQEQMGMAGSIVFHPEQEAVPADHDQVVLLSDWSNENPHDILRHLKEDDDFYALKKGNVPSWKQAIENHGIEGIKNRIKSSATMMGPMDLSDVGYDAVLANGERSHRLSGITPNSTVRLRMINGSASSYFNMQYACGAMTIVAKDGVDVVPIDVNIQRIATAETFDVIVKAPGEGETCEFRATLNDGSLYNSTMIGNGAKIQYAPTLPKPDLTAPHDHSHHGASHDHMDHDHMDHEKMDHSHHHHHGHDMKEPPQDMVEYERLRALHPTSYEGDRDIHNVHLSLTGSMENYSWSFNNKPFSEDPQIKIKRGDIIRLILKNETMMNHPIHLHGHFFRVHNGQGEYSPLMHTVNVPPMEEVRIEFAADESGDWPFHCHNLYHMMSGMMRVVSYENSMNLTPQKVDLVEHDTAWFPGAELNIQSHMFSGEAHIGNSRHEFEIEGQSNYGINNFEAEVTYSYKLAPNLNINPRLFMGGSVEREPGHHGENDIRGTVGIRAELPGQIDAEIRGDYKGGLRLKFGNEHQLTDRVSAYWGVKIHMEDPAKPEYHGGVQYDINKNLSVTGGYNSRFKSGGVGIKLSY